MESAQVVLQRTLTHLLAQRSKVDKEIKAVQTALVGMGVRSPRLAVRRKRKPMTTAERKSVSRRMKAYWARQRAQKQS